MTSPTETQDIASWFTTQWDAVTSFPFVEDENCNITGYGHRDKAAFAAEVNRYDTHCNGEAFPEVERWDESCITHRWAVIDPDGERLWVEVDGKPVTVTTAGAVPITCLWGQR